MEFWIKKVILWPRDKSFEPRELPLKNNKVNVIWGDSRTGKSALIPIIDYCLCSGDCGIPVDTIRNACSWFGVLFATDWGEILLCRAEPGLNQSTGEMLFLRDESICIPNRIEKGNSNVDDVKELLNQSFGITNLEVDYEKALRSDRPSFRDFAAFLYQPQNIIANPEALFYKLNDMDHKRKLSKIFPYVLGAVTEHDLAVQSKIEALKLEIARKERELTKLASVSERWVKSAEAELVKAASYGLIEEIPNTDSFEELLGSINDILQMRDGIKLSTAGLEASSNRLAALKDEEARLSGMLSEIQSAHARITEVQNVYQEYRESSQRQIDYLGITDWLYEQCDASMLCPICGAHLTEPRNTLDGLLSRREELSHGPDIHEMGQSLDKEKLNLEQERDRTAEQLSALRASIADIESARTEREYRLGEIERFLGGLEAKYERFAALNSSDDLRNELEELRKRKTDLESEFDARGSNGRLLAALEELSNRTAQHILELDIENPEWRTKLDCKNLTLKIIDNYGQYRLLNQVGSASNWLSYHTALILALHGFFHASNSVNVPTYLVFDQPSQVYFPHNDMEEQDNDRDKEAVRKIFRVMNDFVGSDTPFQIIVTEHAGRSIWGDLPDTVEAAHWSEDGEKLVPKEWLKQ